jgi:hypothetical protein
MALKATAAVLGFLVAVFTLVPAAAGTGSLTWSWVAPTANQDASQITGAITYNFYSGPTGAETLTKTGITTPYYTAAVAPGASLCATITAVVNGIESSHTPEVCGTSGFPTPNAPTGLNVK